MAESTNCTKLGSDKNAAKSGWFDLATSYDAIKSAIESRISGGTNIHAGLLAGKAALEEHPNICAYIARGESRPAYKRAFDAQWAVFTTAQSPKERGN